MIKIVFMYKFIFFVLNRNLNNNVITNLPAALGELKDLTTL